MTFRGDGKVIQLSLGNRPKGPRRNPERAEGVCKNSGGALVRRGGSGLFYFALAEVSVESSRTIFQPSTVFSKTSRK
jgi:hypothetical protein